MKKNLISIILAGLLSCSALQAQETDGPMDLAEPEKAKINQLSQYMQPGLAFCEIDPTFYKRFHNFAFAMDGINLVFKDENCNEINRKIKDWILTSVDEKNPDRIRTPDIVKLKKSCSIDSDFANNMFINLKNERSVINSCDDVNDLSIKMDLCKKAPKLHLRIHTLMRSFQYSSRQYALNAYYEKKGIQGGIEEFEANIKKGYFPEKRLGELYSKQEPTTKDCFEAAYLTWSRY